MPRPQPSGYTQGNGFFFNPQPATGTLQQQQQAYRQNVFGVGGRPTGRSGQQVYNPLTGQYQDQPGVFQGGTSNRRAGLPQGGIVGAPDLGTASELMRFADQVPGGEDYLRNIGMMPEISTYGAGQSYHAGSAGMGFGQAGGALGALSAMSSMPGTPTRTPAAPAQGFTLPGLGGLGGANSFGNASIPLNVPGSGTAGLNLPTVPGGNSGGFGGFLEGQVRNFLNNPSGYSPTDVSNMRTRASETVAGLQNDAMNRAREDAVRRGASTSAGGDSDIRDSLNRVAAAGSQQQIRAGQDIDKLLAEARRAGTLGGISAGTGLYGQQLGDIQNLRQILTALAALQQSQGAQGGLSMILGR